MSAGWLVYALVTGTLIALAACAIEGLARARSWPTRWIWAAAMAATLAAMSSAIDLGGGSASGEFAVGVAVTSASADVAISSTLIALVLDLRRIAETTIVAGVATLARPLPAWIGGAVGALWLVCAVAALATLALVHVRLRRAWRSWPAAVLHGRRVRVAPSVGPAVVGIVRPEIIVPQWLLERAAEEQQLVLMHEEEHVRARDHLLLGAACVAIALMPWHPAAWWMLARLRLAIELDCDARVLRRGVVTRSYGEMLIDLAGQCSGFRVGATALADKTSHLERRLLAMRPTAKRYPHVRAAALCGAAALSLAAACEARVPTSAEISAMDVAGAERGVLQAKMMDQHELAKTTFFLNGVKIAAREAHNIAPNQIERIHIEKGIEGRGTVRITTNGQAAATEPAGGRGALVRMHNALHGAATPERTEPTRLRTPASADGMSGLILVDGKRMDPAAFHKLGLSDFKSVEIIKGPEAMKLYADPAAANGVIKVTTKR